MFVFFILIVLLLIATLAASLRAVYGLIAVKELKRRGSKGDHVADKLYQVSRHGLTADFLLLSVSVIASALAFVIIAKHVPLLIAALLIAGFIFLVFSVLPKRLYKIPRKLALRISPQLAELLVRIRPGTNRIAAFTRRFRPVTIHTGLYEKEDLLELLQRQKVVPHNRIEATELELMGHVLTFGDKKVHDHMIPKRVVHFVHSEEPVGPILLSELYESGFSRFPVRNDDEAIVGTLFLKDLVDKRTSGIVSNVMSTAVFYVNESAPLEQVLAAFINSKHHLFIVVNSFEEVTGIITIEDVLEQMLGRKIVDESDRFDDMRVVAAKDAATDSAGHNKP